MDLLSLGASLIISGCISADTFSGAVLAATIFDRHREATASSILAVMGSSIASVGLGVSKVAIDNNTQEITGYVSSLSDEELENLSEDLILEDISDADIEEELADRMDLLSENSEMFSLDEYRELLQESVISYLRQLNYFNPEEYDEIIELFSDGYDEGEISEKIEKSLVIKKMNL